MRTTIVPAQITTVEDKIAGNLTLTQVFLLLAPIFIASIVYIVFPPKLNFALYKLLIIIISAIIFGLLAVRIKGYIVLYWIVILLRYNSRPRYFIYNKNDLFMRELIEDNVKIKAASNNLVINKAKVTEKHRLTFKDIFTLEKYISDPNSGLSIKFSEKGGMYVSLSKVE